jgi:hypothetical protein
MDCFAEPVIRRRFAPTGWLAMTRKERATFSASSPAHAGDPVRRGFSAETLASLEYWIARSRLRQGYAAAPLCWRAEALVKAASRAMTGAL